MGLRISTNVPAMAAHRNLATADQAMRTSLERLSSGFRVNRAADDAAGLAISEGLRSQIGGLTQALRNTRDGISVVQTAEGALAETTALLQRMRDLVVQAANDGAVDMGAKVHVQAEITQLKAELTRIADTTTFNGTRLLDGSYDGTFQVGAGVGETLRVSLGDSLGAVGLGVARIDVTRGDSSVLASAAQGAGSPYGGALVFDDVTTSPVGIASLRGIVTVGAFSLDLGSVTYDPGPDGVLDNAEALVQLNAAAVAQGFTYLQGAGVDPFVVDSDDDLIFRGPTPAVTDTAAVLGPLTPQFTPPVTPVDWYPIAPQPAPPPQPGTLLFTRTATADIPALRGRITANGHTLDLASVTYGSADGTQALAALNAAAKAAGITTEDDAFAVTSVGGTTADSGPALRFTGPVPAVTATPTEVAAATPVYTPALSLIATIDAAIGTVSTQRAELGAVQNRFEHTIANVAVALENTTAAESRIRDTDMAVEMTRFTRTQVLAQASTAMLAQATQAPQAVLKLLQA